jgi:hypothetical protein
MRVILEAGSASDCTVELRCQRTQRVGLTRHEAIARGFTWGVDRAGNAYLGQLT